jgi:N-acetylglucosamine-6-phosphate deacetylase
VSSILLTNCAVVLPGEKLEQASVLIEEGKIAAVTQGEASAADVRDLSGATLYPGFIDIHLHGAAGFDVMAADAAGILEIASFIARRGVTAWLPTFVPDAEENYRRAIGAIDEFMGAQGEEAIAQALGVHYEGPFVSEKQCGALHGEHFREFSTGEELSSLPRLSSDNAKHLMTVAPEVSGGIELIKKLCADGWVVSLGHTRAEVETLDAALAAGARHMTHFFNAMSGLHHRDVGAVGWGLQHDDVTCDVIADGIHVNPAVLKVLYQAKTSGLISLISDSILPTGKPDGDYEVWGERISIKNGRTSNRHGSIAGSVITVLDAVRTMLSLGIPEWEVARMASLNPARILSMDAERGTIEPGKRADLVALDAGGHAVMTMIGGRFVS